MTWSQQLLTGLQATSMGTVVCRSMYSCYNKKSCAQPGLTDNVTRPLTIVNGMIYYNSAYELRRSMIYLHKMLVTASTMHSNVVNPSKVGCKDNMFS